MQFYLLMALFFGAFVSHRRSVRLVSLFIFCASSILVPVPILVFAYSPLFVLGLAALWKVAGIESTRHYFAVVLVASIGGVIAMDAKVVLAGVIASMAIAFVKMDRNRVLALLGATSYSFYLVHVPIGGRVVNLGTRFADTVLLQLLVLCFALAVSLACAYLLTRLVERPAQRLAARFRYRSTVNTVI